MSRIKRIWCLSPMRAAKVQASLRIRAVSPEPPLLAHTSSESRRTFRQKARSLAPLNGWACAVKIYHDAMLEDTNSLDASRYRFLVVLRYIKALQGCFCSNKGQKNNLSNYQLLTIIEQRRSYSTLFGKTHLKDLSCKKIRLQLTAFFPRNCQF